MGMSASQGRMLSLTARRNNDEYQGQQINQQRTTLASQSSNMNTQLLSMKVPTPPSSGDFSKTVYTFSKGDGTTSTIDSLVANTTPVNSYTVKYSTIKSESGTAYIPSTNYGVSSNRTQTGTDPATGNPVYSYAVGGVTLKTLNPSSASDAAALANLRSVSPSTDANESFFGADTDNNGSYDLYCSAEELANGAWVNDSATVNKYLIGEHQVNTENTGIAYLQSDASSGRLTSIALVDSNGTTGAYTALTTTTKTDNTAYDDAMNQYEYDKAQYEKMMSDINAKLEIIQQQDKSLELKLNALDADQKAISTEQDAVKKVVDKNIESTFKTFG